MSISHTAAYRNQADFPVEAKITKVGKDIWSAETAGARLYELVLAKYPATVQKVLDLASKLDAPFSAKAVQGHLRWLYTGGELEVDGKSYIVPVKPTKKVEAPKAEATKPAKEVPAAKVKTEPKVAAAKKQSAVRTKKLSRAA